MGRTGAQAEGKLHITVGSSDTIRLEEPVGLLRDRLQNLGSDAKFSFLEGHDHFNVYDNGLAEKMALEMSGTNTPPSRQKPGTDSP